MSTTIEINGQRLTLDQRRQLGPGGSEGNVFLATLAGGQEVAVKIYHTPSSARAEKLEAFLSHSWNLPLDRIALPQQLAYAAKGGHVVGFSMPYLGTRFTELARLGNRRYRNSARIGTGAVVRLFLDGAITLRAIHQNGLVVGDFSDQNALYTGEKMCWIDVDSWQLDGYPCPVGTEDFLAPELYGVDLSLQPSFLPEHDWYTFSVHLFRSLLLTHPYGGNHRTYKTLLRRAEQHVWVLDKAVAYPGVASSPDLLSDELLHTFENIFVQGKRGDFPYEQLEQFQALLITCTSCQQEYPRGRHTCPLCQIRTVILMPPVVSQTGIVVREILRTEGPIIFSKVLADTLTVIAYEHGKTVLYQQELTETGLSQSRRLELFKATPGATYDLFDHILVMHVPQRTTLYGIDIASDQPGGLFQVEASLFAGTRSVVFYAAAHHLFYIQNGTLFMARFVAGALHAQPVRPVLEQQTWFTVAPQFVHDQPVIVGFFQIYRQLSYWLICQGVTRDIELATLDTEEVQLDIQVYFSSQGVFIRRFTQERGVDYLRTALLDHTGKMLFQSAKIRSADYPYAMVRGQAYAHGILLHASDQGLVQEQIINGTRKTFAATQTHIRDGDTLLAYGSQVLITKEHQVVLMSI